MEVEGLLSELGSLDFFRRKKAMEGLLPAPEDSYLPFIEKAIRDGENATLRNAAIEFYRMLGTRALPSLTALVRDEDEDVRVFAVTLLGDIGATAPHDGATAPHDGATSPHDGATSPHDIAATALRDAVNDPDVNVRIAVAEAFGKTGDTETVVDLARMLDDAPWVAMAAIKSIGEIGGPGALDALYACLEKKPQYKGMLFEAIEKAGDRNSIRTLTPFVEKDDLRPLALKAIVNIALREKARPAPPYFASLAPLLMELRTSPDAELRKSAFIALGWSEDLRGLPCLIDGLRDEELQEHAIAGITGLGKRAVPAVIDALRDTERPQRYVLARLLSMMGEHRALVRFAEDRDAEVRVEVALALSRLPSEKAIHLLSTLLKDPEPEVRDAARRAVETLNAGI